MSGFLRLVKKELRELLRPRYLVPLLIAPLFIVITMQGVGEIQEQAGHEMEVAVLSNDSGEYGQKTITILKQTANVTYTTSSISPRQALENAQSTQVLVVVPGGFTEQIKSRNQATLSIYSTIDAINFASTTRSARINALSEAVNEQLSLATMNVSSPSLDTIQTTHTTYVRGTQVTASPAMLSEAFSLRFFLLGLMMVFAIFGAGQLMIQGMGSEKEAKTLETLLTMPVKRRTLVAAKLTSGTVLGLFLAGLYTAAIYFARPSSLNTVAALPQLSSSDYVLLGLLLALAIVDILALALLLGVFADDSRGAQTLMVPLMLVTMAPVFVILYLGLSSFSLPVKIALFAIPSTYPVIAPQRLLFGDTAIVYTGIVYESIFAIVMIGLSVRLFNSDRLITGDIGRFGKLLDKLQR